MVIAWKNELRGTFSRKKCKHEYTEQENTKIKDRVDTNISYVEVSESIPSIFWSVWKVKNLPLGNPLKTQHGRIIATPGFHKVAEVTPSENTTPIVSKHQGSVLVEVILLDPFPSSSSFPISSPSISSILNHWRKTGLHSQRIATTRLWCTVVTHSCGALVLVKS